MTAETIIVWLWSLRPVRAHLSNRNSNVLRLYHQNTRSLFAMWDACSDKLTEKILLHGLISLITYLVMTVWMSGRCCSAFFSGFLIGKFSQHAPGALADIILFLHLQAPRCEREQQTGEGSRVNLPLISARPLVVSHRATNGSSTGLKTTTLPVVCGRI